MSFQVPFTCNPNKSYVKMPVSAYRWAARNLNGISQCTFSYGASKDIVLVHTVQLKPQSSGRMVSSGISDILQSPETDFRHETEASKVMVDFKFDALYR